MMFIRNALLFACMLVCIKIVAMIFRDLINEWNSQEKHKKNGE